jgi:hypothetical protein
MEKPEGIITEEDTVYDVLTKYPGLKEVLIRISPKFKNLQNPVMFNTVAKITSLGKASKIGNIYIKEMLYELNEAIGKGGEFLNFFKSQIPKMQEEFLKKQFGTGSAEKGAEKPEWMGQSSAFEEFDARKVDGEPFTFIMDKAGSIKQGNGFVLIQKFEPAPIINYLQTQGFESYVDKKTEDEVRVYFHKK